MPRTGKNFKIDSLRLWNSLMEMAKIGPGEAGGNNRQALTDDDAKARKLLQTWGEESGLVVSVDQMGTMFMSREGVMPEVAPVYIGSHLDTQPTGGKYDGVLGVLAGLEVIRTLNDLGIRTRRPIVVANWTNEEGSRFSPPMLASGVFAGIYSKSWAYERLDAQGMKFGDELERIGWQGAEEVGQRKIHSFFELHIEQGSILETERKEIGVVTHAQGLRWIQAIIHGKESHTGTTPMAFRKNAGLAMATAIGLVDQIALSNHPHALGTVGHMEVFPNSRNVIPGKALFTIDLRSPDVSVLREMEDGIKAQVAHLCEKMDLSVEFENVGGFDPVAFDESCIEVVRNAAEQLGYSHRNIISGAGHDACWISHVAPTAMIMCPCVGGLSHNEAEEILPQWAEAGTNVLLYAVIEAAGIAH